LRRCFLFGNGLKALEFYKAAFGATELFKVESETREIVARLSVEGAEFLDRGRVASAFEFQPGVVRRRHGAHGD
jgi:uncharacterized glyoxalase superfamily protein PhnB